MKKNVYDCSRNPHLFPMKCGNPLEPRWGDEPEFSLLVLPDLLPSLAKASASRVDRSHGERRRLCGRGLSCSAQSPCPGGGLFKLGRTTADELGIWRWSNRIHMHPHATNQTDSCKGFIYILLFWHFVYCVLQVALGCCIWVCEIGRISLYIQN